MTERGRRDGECPDLLRLHSGSMSTEPARAAWIDFQNDFLRSAAAFLLPSACLACGSRPVEEVGAGGVCGVCWDRLPTPAPFRCGICDEPLPAFEAEICGRCLLEPPPFSRLRSAAPYRGSAREILIAFKFRFADYLADHLAGRMTSGVEGIDFDEVVPVPATAASPAAPLPPPWPTFPLVPPDAGCSKAGS